MTRRAMVVVGGGSSERFGSDKLMADIGGRPLLEVTVAAVAPHVDRCVVVVRPELVDYVSGLGLPAALTPGGPTRTLSEMAGLAAIGEEVDLIGIHDAARPVLAAHLIDELFAVADRVGGAVPVVDSTGAHLERHTNRLVEGLSQAQTPQVFRASDLMVAYVKAAQAGYEGHDTAEVVQKFSECEIAAVAGDPDNIKVTYPSDLKIVKARM